MMEEVLCVCPGNTSRSPMMRAMLQQQLGAAFLVESVGVRKKLAGRPANEAMSTMRAAGMAMVETGDDPGYAPSRATCERAGFERLPVARHFRAL